MLVPASPPPSSLSRFVRCHFALVLVRTDRKGRRLLVTRVASGPPLPLPPPRRCHGRHRYRKLCITFAVYTYSHYYPHKQDQREISVTASDNKAAE